MTNQKNKHMSTSRRCSHFWSGVCGVYRLSNTAFHNSVGSVMLFSPRWSEVRTRHISSWAPIDFFLFPTLFSLVTSDFVLALLKIKCVMLVCICINFDPYSPDCYLFCC